MKKNGLFFLLFIASCHLAFAKPILTKGKYLISTLSDGAIGTVSLGTSLIPLVYNPDTEIEMATESDYWIVKSVGADEYTFQNSSTLQYIKHDVNAASDRNALVMVDALQADNSTSFKFELKEVNNLCYYVIRSVVNPVKIWNKRSTLYSSMYPVGVYSGSGSANECFILYDSDGNAVIDDKKTATNKPTIWKTLGAFDNFADSLTFNKKTPVVDTNKKEFYLSIPEASVGTDVPMKIRFTPKNVANILYINNVAVPSGSTYTFTNVTAASIFSLEIKDGGNVLASGNLMFSCIPLVQIYTTATIGSVYSLTRLAVTEPTNIDSTELVFSNIKVRGATSSSFPKKSYAVKILNVDAVTDMDRSYLGLRTDNNWILDAMYIDPGRMRNRVSTDLWNAFSTRPYFAVSEPAMINGTRGKFVEVFLNNAYHGLYCMTEKVDRKQLKLKKLKYNADSTIITQRGGLYKASSWSIGTFLGKPYGGSVTVPMYNNNNAVWSSFEAKYPDLDDGEPLQWKPLYDAIVKSSNATSDLDFTEGISASYDLPLFLDYYLFIDLLLASDNHGKNTYLSVYDQSVSSKMVVTPWDCDGTWGIRWNGSKNLTFANQSFEPFITAYEHGQNNLYLRLRSLNLDGYLGKLKTRYQELRGSYFSYNNLITRFQTYNALFNKSGAGEREKVRWGVQDINLEMNFLSTWITDRLSYLDNQYLGGPYSSITNLVDASTNSNIRFAPNPVSDMLSVSNTKAGQSIQLISLQGSLLASILSNGSDVRIDMSAFVPGVYLLKSGNEIYKIIKK